MADTNPPKVEAPTPETPRALLYDGESVTLTIGTGPDAKRFRMRAFRHEDPAPQVFDVTVRVPVFRLK